MNIYGKKEGLIKSFVLDRKFNMNKIIYLYN